MSGKGHKTGGLKEVDERYVAGLRCLKGMALKLNHCTGHKQSLGPSARPA